VKNVALTSIDLRLENYDEAWVRSFYRELLTRIDSTGVRGALAAVAPFRGVRMVGIALEGGSPASPVHEANSNLVSGNSFEAPGIHLAQGRTFSDAEVARGDAVAVISGAMARAYWKDQNPLGKRFLYGAKGRMQPAEVIGVARDVRSIHIHTPDGPLFYSIFQAGRIRPSPW